MYFDGKMFGATLGVKRRQCGCVDASQLASIINEESEIEITEARIREIEVGKANPTVDELAAFACVFGKPEIAAMFRASIVGDSR